MRLHARQQSSLGFGFLLVRLLRWASASKRCVTSVTKKSWSWLLTCPASPSEIWPICRSSSLTRWSIFGLFSQSCSDVTGLGSCGEGDGLGCGSGRRFPSGWRQSCRFSLGSNRAAWTRAWPVAGWAPRQLRPRCHCIFLFCASLGLGPCRLHRCRTSSAGRLWRTSGA
jgi:hypothetical protein